MCLTYHQVFNVDLTIIRTSFVYGPHRRKRQHLADSWLRKALAGEVIEIPDMADHQIDWTYAEDVAQGIYLAYSVRPVKHRVFNISQGKNTTLSELAQVIMDLVPGSRINREPDKSEYFNTVIPVRGPGDITRAREELGYVPQYTIQKGVAELLDWIKKKEPLLANK
jgi:nucleoside-diphosphate-sugar epimerase